MFEELIGNLRACSRCDFGQDCGKCTLKSSETTFCCDVLLHEAADAIEALEIKAEKFKSAYIAEHNARIDKIKRNMWIPVTERLPSWGEDVLISISGFANVGHLVQTNDEKQYNWFYSGWYHDPWEVTHWMPLPEPPKTEEEEG